MTDAPLDHPRRPSRYVIIGAGAVGGTIGALLTESGRDVVLVARGAHLDALRSEGLRFASPRGTRTVQIPAIGGPEEIDLRLGDVLVLCVKSQDTAAVVQTWAGQTVAGSPGSAGDLLPIVCAQNGVENERAALRRFAQVYGMSVMMPASHLEPGSVTVVADPVAGVLVLGRYPSGADELSRQIGADLVASRFIAPVVERVTRWKYAKLLRNLANAIEALCGPVSGDPDAEHLSTLVRDEGARVLAAAGIDTATDAEQAGYLSQLITHEVADAPRTGGSSWQSLSRRLGRIESSYLNGEIVLLGRLNGVPVGVNALLQNLAEHAAAAGLAPGSLTARQILDRLESILPTRA